MSLRIFHIVFIGFSFLLAIGFGAWGIDQYSANDAGWGITVAVLSALSSILLLVYAKNAWRKLRALTREHPAVVLSAIVLLLLLASQYQALACPSCYGDPESSTAQGANAAIILLFGVTGSVVGGVIAFFMWMRKLSYRVNAVSTDDTSHTY